MTDTSVQSATTGWLPENTFAARLALVRNRQGWNVSEAARACGLDDGSWSNWEAGKGCRQMDKVATAIARTTGCSYIWLLTGRAPSGRGPAGQLYAPWDLNPEPAGYAKERLRLVRETPPQQSRPKAA